MKPRVLARAALVAGYAVVALAASRPPAKGVTYRLRMTTQLPAVMAQMSGDGGAPVIMAKVKSVGRRAKFEFVNPVPGVAADAYVLMLDSNRTVLVDPAERTFAEAPAALGGGGGLGMLSAMAGAGRRGRGGVPSVEINGLVTDLQQLDGDTLQGRPVRHYQLVAEMNVQVMGNMAPLRIEMETWTADLPFAIVNPFDLTGTPSPDDPMLKLTSKLLELRKKMQGTPLKTIMTLSISGLGNGALPPLEFQQTTAITDLKELDVDTKDLDVPVGFTKKVPGSGTDSRR
jgi:hypothetical protein